MLPLEICRCLWSLFLAFFRSKPDVLPLSSEKTSPVGNPELLQRRGSSLASSGRSAGSHHLHPRPIPHGHPQSRAYSLILPDRHFGPPPRPPHSQSSVSEDESSTTPDVHLPSVIVTPCTPSKASRTCTLLDELDSDESSGSDDANSSITSVDSNPFLSDPSSPLQKGTRLPRLGPPAHHRARSLTGTSRGLYHQRPSRSTHSHNQFSSLLGVADAAMSTNPVKKSDSVGPSTSNTSFVRSRTDLNFVWDSTSQPITDKRIRSYTTTKSADQPVASTRRSEDPKSSVTASTAALPALLDATVITPSVHGHAQPNVVPYAEVFDFDAYIDSDSSLPSESSLKSSLSSTTTDSSESKDSFPIPTTSPSFRSPLRRTSNISDTSASSASIYTYSLSAVSTDMDESPSSHSPRIPDGKSKVTFDHEVKRYRDHYRPPAYSRSPAFVIESPTTSRKFTGRRESDGISIKSANKENEMIGPTTTLSSTSTAALAKLSDTDSMAPPSHVGDKSTTGLPSNPQQEFRRPFRTSDSSTTTASLSPAGKNHRLGPVAISQRRRM